MGVLAFFGYTLIGAGPPAAVFVEFIVSSPFVLLVSLASAFFWVTVLLANSVVFRVLLLAVCDGKCGRSEDSYVSVVPLVAFFACEEALRPFVHKFTVKATDALEKRAVSLRHPKLTKLEKLRIHLGIGAGQGVAHSCLLFLNTVVTSYRGTYYNQTRCPQIPYFLVAAISSSTMFLLLSFAMVVTSVVFRPEPGSDLTSRRFHARTLLPLGIHASGVVVSFLNLIRGGCIAACVANCGLTLAVVAGAWKLTSDLAKNV